MARHRSRHISNTIEFRVRPCVRKRTATVLHPNGRSRTVGKPAPLKLTGASAAAMAVMKSTPSTLQPAFSLGSCRPRTTVPPPLPSPTAWLPTTPESRSVEVVNTASGERIWSRWLGDPLLAQPATQSLADLRRATPWKARRSNAPPISTSAAERCARRRARNSRGTTRLRELPRPRPRRILWTPRSDSAWRQLRRRSKRSVRCSAKPPIPVVKQMI
jgi:hypothetical protein